MSNPNKFKVRGLAGKKSLSGSISVKGAKNAALKLMAGSILCGKPMELTNVPEISDITKMGNLLSFVGAVVKKKEDVLSIDATRVSSFELEENEAKKIRASVVLTGPILARMGKVRFSHPGGCVIGNRPIDIFLNCYKKMGASVKEEGEWHVIEAPSEGLFGADIFFNIQSVTATETIIMAAVLAKGKTILRNAAMEPEIKELADFLNARGANIKGAGTPTISIEGNGGSLLPSEAKPHKIIPDRIEAGSFLILGALCAKELLIRDCNPEHLGAVIQILRESGVPIETGESSILIKGNTKRNSEFKSFNLKTHEYPGFPTDLQAPTAVFLTQTSGESLIFETVFENRLGYAEMLIRMGADIKVWDAHRAIIKSPSLLHGKELESPDLRAGLAFIIAALSAEGESVIGNAELIDRGYEKIEERLQEIGADIERISI